MSSFGSDQVLVFDVASGRFIDALGDSDSLDSPEGIAISTDGGTLYVASFLNSRILAFDIKVRSWAASPVQTIVAGTPVDLDYLADDSDQHPPLAGVSMLHGPEGVLLLDKRHIAVTSYYNKSVVIVPANQLS